MKTLAALLLLSAPAFAIVSASGDLVSVSPGTVVLLTEQGSLLRLSTGKRTRFVCAKKNVKGAPRGIDPRCPLADLLYDPATKNAVLIEMRPRRKGEPRPVLSGSGEVATTDALAGTLSVRFSDSGVTLPFKVGEASRMAKPLEELKVGDLVELRSLDRSTVDELKLAVSPAP